MKSSIMFGVGYLAKHLMEFDKSRKWVPCKNLGDVFDCLNAGGIDEVWHFACPGGDFNEDSKYKMFSSLAALENLIQKLTTDTKLVFASSMGAFDCENKNPYQKLYNNLKYIENQMIQLYSRNYSILYIPRVYSSDRNKGLIRRLRDGEIVYLAKEITYIDIKDFCEQTIDGVNKNDEIVTYIEELGTIGDIKKRYIIDAKETELDYGLSLNPKYEILENYTIKYERNQQNS